MVVYKGEINGLYKTLDKAIEYAECLDGFENFIPVIDVSPIVFKWTLNGKQILEIRHLPNIKG